MKLPFNAALKAAVFFVGYLCFAATGALAGDIEGSWTGELALPTGPLALTIHIDAAEGGHTALLDVPAQGLAGMAATQVNIESDSVTVEWAPLSATFEADIEAGAGRLNGVWRQGGANLPLLMTKGVAAAMRRPQEPQPPHPYNVEDLTVPGGGDGVTLAGTLTTPAGDGPWPLVVLITGSGPQDRDENIAGHKPFLVIADHLTRAGYAVFRYDDRGTAGSGGDFAAATSEDFARDAAAVMRAVSSRAGIDKGRTYYLGHSEGASVAAMAQVRFHKVSGLLLIAPPGVPMAEIILEQSRLLQTASGDSERVIQSRQSLQRRINEIAAGDEPPERVQDRVADLLRREGAPADQVAAQAATVASPWFRYTMRYDPMTDLASVAVPVLALFGAIDMQVPAGQNAVPIQAALAEKGHPRSRVIVLPDLNHLMQTATTGLPAEYAQIEQTIAPLALDVITAFLRSL